MTEEPQYEPPFDPREFSLPEWEIITRSLRKTAAALRWRAGHPGRNEQNRAEMLAAAERQQELAHRAVSARVFCRDLRAAREVAPGGRAD